MISSMTGPKSRRLWDFDGMAQSKPKSFKIRETDEITISLRLKPEIPRGYQCRLGCPVTQKPGPLTPKSKERMFQLLVTDDTDRAPAAWMVPTHSEG